MQHTADDTLRDQIEGLLGLTPAQVAENLGLDLGETDDGEEAVLLPGYMADDGEADEYYPDAESGREAADEYVETGSWGDTGCTIAVEVTTWRVGLYVDSDGDMQEGRCEERTRVIIQHPPEPDCKASDDGKHRWAQPHSLLGGLEDNPGVQAHGGVSVSVHKIWQAAQGDLLIRRVEHIPEGLEPAAPTGGVHVVAHSETGHHHQLAAAGVEYLPDPKNPLIAYLRIATDDGVTLEHMRPWDTHAPIHIPRGAYQLRLHHRHLLDWALRQLEASQKR